MGGADPLPVELARLTTFEAADALKRAEVLILPVGATEQHGPNLTLDADTEIAYALAKRVAEKLYPKVLVAPALPFGVSYHHMGFPGTITLAPETFLAVVLDVAKSLKQHGVRRLFILDGHAGNQGVLDAVVTKLRFELGMPAAYLFYFTLIRDLLVARVTSSRWGHACEVETSVGLAIAPHIVRADALAAGILRQTSLPFTDPWQGVSLTAPIPFEEITANGALGDARLATAEFGNAIVDGVVERVAHFLMAFIERT